MDVLVLFLAFLDDLLDGLHLSLYEPTGLWEPRDEVVCWMLQWVKWCVGYSILWTKSWNCFQTYCGPLSLTVLSGQPKNYTIFFISSMTILLVVACMGVMMGYFEKWSDISRKCFPSTMSGSVPSFFQRPIGVSEMMGAFLLQHANS